MCAAAVVPVRLRVRVRLEVLPRRAERGVLARNFDGEDFSGEVRLRHLFALPEIFEAVDFLIQGGKHVRSPGARAELSVLVIVGHRKEQTRFAEQLVGGHAREHDRCGFARGAAHLQNDTGENPADRIRQDNAPDGLPARGPNVPARFTKLARNRGQGFTR